MSSAVDTLQEAIKSGRTSLTQLLRQTQTIAAKLNLTAVEQWVSRELTGYTEDPEPPNYRKVYSHRLEIYNAGSAEWQFAGHLHFALPARQPISEIEIFSREESVSVPVAKNFSIKNDFGDPFGSDWPQRFVIAGWQFERILEAVTNRWTTELETHGIHVGNLPRFLALLDTLAP